MKRASAIVHRILIDTGSSVDIIIWDYLKKFTHLECDIVPLVHPILGFDGQEVNPTGMIRLSVRFGDKLKSKNLKVDFLVVDVPTAYNVILGRPTRHKYKAEEQSTKEDDEEERRKNKGKRGGLHIGLSTILMTVLLKSLDLSIQGVSCLIPYTLTLTLARRRNKFHLLGFSAFVLGMPRNSCPPEIPELVSPRLCANPPRYRYDPTDILAPWLEPPFQPPRSLQPWTLRAPPLVGVVFLLSLLGVLISLQLFPAALVSGRLPLQPSALRSSSHPSSERFGHCYLLLGDPGEIRGARGRQGLGLN
ncbi:LOW QUALITY PROTEIN: hypothetical protein Cgig2_012833 [Carnegiea gigantea]|uniref:Uncharacterized protein n=1 Tax=Carnegiea gigantea TaxID=171969 RepID=A0A9Q1K8W8_9CARY|nr:LOW QUALITY PROTEIN: hypothetical protein Cgig2_012833 [Carnegiea gigantea]